MILVTKSIAFCVNENNQLITYYLHVCYLLRIQQYPVNITYNNDMIWRSIPPPLSDIIFCPEIFISKLYFQGMFYAHQNLPANCNSPNLTTRILNLKF